MICPGSLRLEFKLALILEYYVITICARARERLLFHVNAFYSSKRDPALEFAESERHFFVSMIHLFTKAFRVLQHLHNCSLTINLAGLATNFKEH